MTRTLRPVILLRCLAGSLEIGKEIEAIVCLGGRGSFGGREHR